MPIAPTQPDLFEDGLVAVAKTDGLPAQCAFEKLCSTHGINSGFAPLSFRLVVQRIFDAQ